MEGYQRAYVDDPFGNRIELMEPDPQIPALVPGDVAQYCFGMLKPELEFHIPQGEWQPAGGPVDGIWEQILSKSDDGGDYTRILRFEPGTDSSANGALTHEFWEEVYIVSGDLTDLRLDETFTAGMYACRPPGMPHGPWVSEEGVVMVEFRHSFPPETSSSDTST